MSETREARYRAIALDAIAAWQGEDDSSDDGPRKRGRSAQTRARLRDRMLTLDAEAPPEPPTPEPDVCDPEMRVQVPTRTVKGYRPRSTPEPEGESLREQIDRLRLMTDPDSDWDLSDNDRAAIATALKALKPTPEPERPAARCVWKEVDTRLGLLFQPKCQPNHLLMCVDDYRFCPFCGQPLTVEAPHA